MIFSSLLISGIGWYFALSVVSVVCEIFDSAKLKSFTESCLLIVKMILAIAVSVFVISVVTAAVVISAGG